MVWPGGLLFKYYACVSILRKERKSMFYVRLRLQTKRFSGVRIQIFPFRITAVLPFIRYPPSLSAASKNGLLAYGKLIFCPHQPGSLFAAAVVGGPSFHVMEPAVPDSGFRPKFYIGFQSEKECFGNGPVRNQSSRLPSGPRKLRSAFVPAET